MDNVTPPVLACSMCRRTRIRKKGVLLCTQCDRTACENCGTTQVGTRTACSRCQTPLKGFHP